MKGYKNIIKLGIGVATIIALIVEIYSIAQYQTSVLYKEAFLGLAIFTGFIILILVYFLIKVIISED